MGNLHSFATHTHIRVHEMSLELLTTFEYILLGLNAGVSLHRFIWDLDPTHSSDANSQIQWYYVLTIPYVLNWVLRPFLWIQRRWKDHEKRDTKFEQDALMYLRAQGVAISLLFILQSYSDIRNPSEGMFPQFEMAAGMGLSVSVTALSMIPFIRGKRLCDVCVRVRPQQPRPTSTNPVVGVGSTTSTP